MMKQLQKKEQLEEIKFSTIFQYRVQLKLLNSIFLVFIFKFQNIKVSFYAARKAAFYIIWNIIWKIFYTKSSLN